MTAQPAPTSQTAFENRYRQSPDPWNFQSSDYERRRYETTMAALGRKSYRYAFEPACSIGELTARLSARCERVIATDFAPSAVARARERCKNLSNVEVYWGDLADGAPPGPFDLIVFSEVGYYFDRTQLIDIALGLVAELEAGGEFVAVHWLGHSADHVLHGNEVHKLLAAHLPLEFLRGSRHPGFRIDSWRRP